MRLCIEIMSQLVLLSISCVILIEIIMVNVYIQEGRNCLHMAVDKIECADDREETALLCAQEAKEKGYVLTWDEINGNNEEKSLLLTLQYNLSLGEGLLYNGEVQAYAR